ncbi:hypothetical protein LTR95_015792, partial [Oleoguttula sp. CCFEE 5521]
MRTAAAHFDDIPGDLPTGTVPEDVDLDSLAHWVLVQVNSPYSNVLTDGVVWRDLFAFTDTYRTIVGKHEVLSTFPARRKETQCGVFERTKTAPRRVSVGQQSSWVDVDASFEFLKDGLPARGRATLSVTRNAGDELCVWLMRTWLHHFEDYGSPEIPRSGEQTCDAVPKADMYDVLIVGGGQAGLSVAGRLQALGIRYVLLEKHKTLGDVWRTRYASLKWHTPKEYGNLPFGRMFADDIPELVPAKAIGNAHEAWAKKYRINSLTDCTVEQARYNGDRWQVRTRYVGMQRTFEATNLVIAIGPGSTHPHRPGWATIEAVSASGFRGKVVHAKEYDSCQEWLGKDARGACVGTANTGHDIVEDMVNAGMQTTMLQRGSTFVLPGEWLLAAEGAHYNARTSNDIADQEQFTMPYKLVREILNTNIHAGIRANPDRFNRLERAGFKLDRFGDLYTNIFTRFGGHYIDTGTSARIANRDIRMETTPARRLVADGIELEDDRVLPCDLVVLATGYDHDFRKDAESILGPEIADRMDDYHGMDPEGEIRGCAKFAGVPHLWYHGGDVRSSRFMSRFLALQIQSQLLQAKLSD